MIVAIYWNDDYETYEALHSDGYIEPLRDDYEAKDLAEKNNMKISQQPGHTQDAQGTHEN